MNEGLKALLQGVIDYAGLFPPAKLPLDDAIRNYARYRLTEDSWMLGRFVIQASRLAELAPYIPELFSSDLPLMIAALGRGGETAKDWTEGVRKDLKEIAACLERHGGRVVIDVFETRIPGALVQADSGECVHTAVESLGPGKSLFLETEWTPPAIQMLKTHGIGLKIRCGGLTAKDFASAERLAGAILAALQAKVPLKLTAGLHHPLPRFDQSIGATMHGFVNVLTAGILASVGRDSEPGLIPILQDTNALHWAFDEGLSWQGHKATRAEIIAARRHAVLSFGSCSFDEPREDLRELGWL